MTQRFLGCRIILAPRRQLLAQQQLAADPFHASARGAASPAAPRLVQVRAGATHSTGHGTVWQEVTTQWSSSLCPQLHFPSVFPSRIARFSSVYHLSIHFPKNFGAETTKIFYIGLKGEWTEVGESRDERDCADSVKRP